MGAVYGPRRVLLQAAAAFAVIALVEPFSPNLQMLLAMQFAGGLATGFFVPLTLSFVLRNMPPKAWAYGVALYALNLELSLNISASLEGWYLEHLSWSGSSGKTCPWRSAWLCFWALASVLSRSVPIARVPICSGSFLAAIGLALIYAALDQGNRLDWWNSGLVWGLMLAGGSCWPRSSCMNCTRRSPDLTSRSFSRRRCRGLLLMISFLRLTILTTSYVIPQFLQVVRGFRALEVGQTLAWIATQHGRTR